MRQRPRSPGVRIARARACTPQHAHAPALAALLFVFLRKRPPSPVLCRHRVPPGHRWFDTPSPFSWACAVAWQVPFIVFTGARDETAPARPMAEKLYASTDAVPKAVVNKAAATHHEPDILDYNPLLPQFSVAWFKIYLDKTPQAYGNLLATSSRCLVVPMPLA